MREYQGHVSYKKTGCALAATLAFACVALTGDRAFAQKAAPTKKPSAAVQMDGKALLAKLQSGDESQIHEALVALQKGGPAGAALASAVADVLAHGLPLALTEAAIAALGDLESPAGSAVLAEYTRHRDPKIRRVAVAALARTKGPAAGPALTRALADPDPSVRGTAASGIGVAKAKDAVASLFLALDHRVNEAAVSIGQLCDAQQCQQLAAKLGPMPFDVITGGLEQVLFRPPSEISDDVKLKIIERIRALGTVESQKFLSDVQKRWTTGSPRLRQALENAVATSGKGAP